MASIDVTLPPGGDGAPAVRFVRASPSQRRAALAMVLTGAAGDDPAVDRFQAFCRSHGLSLEELWLAEQDGRMLAATLLVPNPGRTAMVFLSPVGAAAQVSTTGELIGAAIEAQGAGGIRLAQGLLDPSQTLERQALERAGFHRLARLVYMQRPAEAIDRAMDLRREGMSVLSWREDRRPLFARAIEASYERTLDCPGLLGLRPIDDVIEGHMATGRFDPDMWFLFLRGREAVGVLLLNELPDRGAYELVYLGVPPAMRGRGLGRRLVSFGLTAAAARQARTVVLAVDEANRPAMTLYRDMGFRPAARKVAMIRLLHA